MLVCTTKHNRVQELYFRANQLTTRCHESLISDVSKKKRKTRTGWGTQSDGWERLKCNTGEDEDNGRAGLLIYLHGASLFSRPDIGLPSFSSKPLFLGRNSSGFPSLVIPTTWGLLLLHTWFARNSLLDYHEKYHSCNARFIHNIKFGCFARS
jgi:hypothetical protein